MDIKILQDTVAGLPVEHSGISVAPIEIGIPPKGCRRSAGVECLLVQALVLHGACFNQEEAILPAGQGLGLETEQG